MKALIIAPHPDDETLCCGGSIVSLLPNVRVVIVTDGRYGAPSDELRGTDELVQIRKEETKRAMSILGVKDYIFLDFIDTTLREKKNEVKDKLLSIITEYYPDLVFSPSPLDNHPDHYTIGEIIKDIYPKALFYIIWERNNVDFNKWEEVRINISNYLDLKIKAINEYRSQIGGLTKKMLNKFFSNYEIFYKIK